MKSPPWQARSRLVRVILAMTIVLTGFAGLRTATETVEAAPSVSPTVLCFNLWTTQARVPQGATCRSNEYALDLTTQLPATICVNAYTRAIHAGFQGCKAGQQAVALNSPDDLTGCINRWTGAIRYATNAQECTCNDTPVNVSHLVCEIEQNDDFLSAQPISLFGLQEDLYVHDFTGNNTSTVYPHVSIRGTGNNTVDYYKFTVYNAGDVGIFDIDFGFNSADGIGPDDFDAWIELYNDSFIIIATDDGHAPDPGSGSSLALDPFIEHTFSAPGTYYLAVGSPPGLQPFLQPVPTGATYTLQMSIENHPIS